MRGRLWWAASYVVASALDATSIASAAVAGAQDANAPAIKVLSVKEAPELCVPFHSSDEWQGADGAYSIALNDHNTLWLYGDTFVAPEGRAQPRRIMVNNTVSWLKVDGKNRKMKFFWKEHDSEPASVFAPESKGQWYWPGSGILYGDKLFLFMKRIGRLEDPTVAPEFQFKWNADDLLVVDCKNNESWNARALALPESGKEILFGTAAVQDNRFLYAYCSSPRDAVALVPHPVVVARAPLAKLTDLHDDDWQYWSATDGAWTASRDKATVLFKDAAPEMTVSYLPRFHTYIAVYMPPLTDRIVIRTAARPEGPFSEPVDVYKCPEKQIVLSGNRQVYVYSAKLHPEMSARPDELIITYCANPGDELGHRQRPDLYYPHAIRLQVEPNKRKRL